MLASFNTEEILRRCGSGTVLDVGGWADPFPRADYVLDQFSYETRGICYHGLGQLRVGEGLKPTQQPGERFTRETWILHDITSQRRFPFADKQFDFVICSHTLEDIPNPWEVCRELMRVGKAGYLETPSHRLEMTRSAEGVVGADHHYWIVKMGEGHIQFWNKPGFLGSRRAYHLPFTFTHRIRHEARVTWMFWEDRFDISVGLMDRPGAASLIAKENVPRRFYLRDHLSRWKHRLLRAARGPQAPAGADGTCTWETLSRAARP